MAGWDERGSFIAIKSRRDILVTSDGGKMPLRQPFLGSPQG
jgi:hypothetical protein